MNPIYQKISDVLEKEEAGLFAKFMANLQRYRSKCPKVWIDEFIEFDKRHNMHGSLSLLINDAFCWETTKEGQDFWKNLYEKYDDLNFFD